MWQSSSVGYVVGTESESAIFAGSGIEYGPAGTIHAVDVPETQRSGGPVLGYAICGTPVRIWPQEPFDPAAPGVDRECATLARNR